MPKQGNYTVLALGLLGSCKLALEAFGYKVITDEQVNVLANAVGAVAAIVAAVLNNRKPKYDK